MARTLIVVRHAKSDWNTSLPDHDRPLAPRGRRQAPAVGAWLAEHLDAPVQLAVVSTAVRAQQTWALAAAGLPTAPPQQDEAAAYTFDGADLIDLIASLPAAHEVVALVGHNPAVEEIIEHYTASPVRMRTATLAVLRLSDWTSRTGRLLAWGRPADGERTVVQRP